MTNSTSIIAEATWRGMFPETISLGKKFADEDPRLHACYMETAEAAVKALTASGFAIVPVELAMECAIDLIERCDHDYAKTKDVYPSEKRRYDRDVEPALKLKAMLTAVNTGDKP